MRKVLEMTTIISMLRGVNVGGHNKIKRNWNTVITLLELANELESATD